MSFLIELRYHMEMVYAMCPLIMTVHFTMSQISPAETL